MSVLAVHPRGITDPIASRFTYSKSASASREGREDVMMILEYKCQNEACPEFGEPIQVKPGQEATCDRCGWFLEAIG